MPAETAKVILGLCVFLISVNINIWENTWARYFKSQWMCWYNNKLQKTILWNVFPHEDAICFIDNQVIFFMISEQKDVWESDVEYGWKTGLLHRKGGIRFHGSSGFLGQQIWARPKRCLSRSCAGQVGWDRGGRRPGALTWISPGESTPRVTFEPFSCRCSYNSWNKLPG